VFGQARNYSEIKVQISQHRRSILQCQSNEENDMQSITEIL